MCGAPSSPAPALVVTTQARGFHPGEVVIVNVTSDVPLTRIHARVFDRTFPGARVGDATTETWRILTGIDLDAVPGAATVTVEALSESGPASTTLAIEVTARTFPTRRLTVNPDFVNPPAAAQPRIVEESKRLNSLWTRVTPSDSAHAAFTRPVPHAANSAFGTRSIFNGEPGGAHGGADFLSPAGTPVSAPAAGTVVLADDLYYTGGTVVIDHGLGLYSLFAHLSAIEVREGPVARGAVVGKVGRTGRVTGAHLHWTVRLGGTRVDPIALLELLPDGGR